MARGAFRFGGAELNSVEDKAFAFPGYRSIAGRTVVSSVLNPGITNEIIVAIGQSNISNTVSSLYNAEHASAIDNFNIYDSRVYSAAEPLLGCSARFDSGSLGGNWLYPCADKLIDRGFADRIIIVPIGIDGTSVTLWGTRNLPLYTRVAATLNRLQAVGLTPTRVFWMQGEADHAIGSEANYYAPLREVVRIFRNAHCTAPFYVSQTSYTNGNTSATVRGAQVTGLDPVGLNMLAGPDTDTITGPGGGRYLQGGAGTWIHFNGAGALACAELWADTLSPD